MSDKPEGSGAPPLAPRKPFFCHGCGGMTDGRHLDRALLPRAAPFEPLADLPEKEK